MSRLAAVCLVCAAFAAPPALGQKSFFSDLNLPVNPVGQGQFEVVEKRGAGPRDIWCAAARFATENLGVQRGRIYVAAARGAAVSEVGRKGVTFTTRAPSKPVSTGVQITTRVVGASLPINHAIQFCRDRIIEPSDRF
ncbi:MAG: hypothetical protein AAGM84_10375 [Pseudomonadota bacterium]